MGIGRQSMYDAFGDKHRLYLEALQLYETETGSELFGRVTRASSPFAALCDHVLSVTEGSPLDLSWGCFHVNATTELGSSDPDVGPVFRTSGSRCVAAFEDILKEAKRRGDVDASVDERVAANFLLNTIRGLRVSAKAGALPMTFAGSPRWRSRT